MSGRRSFVERVAALENRLLDGMRSRAAWTVASQEPTGSTESFGGRKHCLLITYRKDGTPVPSPLWFAERDGRLYVHTGGAKLQRIGRNAHVRIAPCTFRGRPLGPPVEATARCLPPDEGALGEAALEAKYGVVRRLYYATLGRGQHDLAVIVEITPQRV